MLRKLGIFSLLLLSTLFFYACPDKDEKSRTVDFWSSKDFTSEAFNQLYGNDNLLGELQQSNARPSCGASSAISISLPTNSKMDLEVRNAQGEKIVLGSISLNDFTSGISVSLSGAANGAEIKVEGTSNDACTHVQLNW